MTNVGKREFVEQIILALRQNEVDDFRAVISLK